MTARGQFLIAGVGFLIGTLFGWGVGDRLFPPLKGAPDWFVYARNGSIIVGGLAGTGLALLAEYITKPTTQPRPTERSH